VKNSTLRVLGIIAAVILVATIGFIAAQAVQSPTSSQIPTVVTDRPTSSAAATPTSFLATASTVPSQPPESRGSDDEHSSHNHETRPEVVTPLVRDNDDHHRDRD
jgi:hypothetical protein